MRSFTVLALVLSSLLAVCQQQPATEKPAAASAAQSATDEDINRLVEAMHIRKNMVEMQRTMIDQWAKPMVTSMASDRLKAMTPQQRHKFQDIVEEMMTASMKAYPAEEMILDIGPIYKRYLDRCDIEAMISFYSSPTGQKFLDSQPKIIGDYMAIIVPKVQERMQGTMKKFQERIRQMAAEPEDEYKPAVPAPAKK